MSFLLDLPSGLSFFIVCSAAVVISLIGLNIIRKRFPPEALKENHEVAAIFFSIFGLLYAVVVAFVVFVTWGGFDEATKNLQMEANESIDLFYGAKGFPDSTRKIIQAELVNYTNSVYNDELKKMAGGELALYSSRALRRLLDIYNTMSEKSMANRELYAESLKRVNNLAEYRRLRIFAGDDTVPLVVWIVLLTGAVLTITYSYFFGAKNKMPQYLMTSVLTITITMILFLIYVLDHPFTGTSSVNTAPLKQVIEIMAKRN